MTGNAQPLLLRISLLAIFLGMTGCVVMDKADCTEANWSELGRLDTLEGKNKFHARAKACKEHGLGADRFSYERGAQAGLIGFCTAASGRAHGQSGKNYRRGFCPSSTEAAFLSGYTPAYQKYKFQEKIRELQSNISMKENSLSNELRMKDRNLQEIESLKRDIKRLKSEMHMEMYMRVID